MRMKHTVWLGITTAVLITTSALVSRAQFLPGPSAANEAPSGAPAVMVMNQPASSTKIEAMLAVRGAVIVRGYSDIGGIDGDEGSGMGIQAVEINDVAKGAKEHGLAVAIRQGGDAGRTIVTYLDYDELDALTSAMNYLQKMDNAVTSLPKYEARYKSKGDLEIANFDSNGVRVISVRGTQITPETGQVHFATAYFPISRMNEVKGLVSAGKEQLDRAKSK
jgi:hypothetical protein